MVVFHFFAPASGGFVGVDLFFVISGFLITEIVAREADEGRFSFRLFFLRRVLRLAPALLITILAVAAAAYAFTLPYVYKQLGKNILAGAVFGSNITKMATTGYFAGEAHDDPLLHVWSLCVEAQFYLLWPLLIVVGKSRRLALVVGVGVLSFATNIILIHRSALDFYSPMTRAWEFAAGGALALAPPGRPKAFLGLAATHLLSSVGVILLCAAFWILGPSGSYPGWKALLPVAASVCLIGAGPGAWTARLLSNRIVVYVGLISYPLYLYHWPVLSLYQLHYGPPDALTKIGFVAVCIGMSALTYRFVERPARGGTVGLPIRLGAIAAGWGLCVTVGAVVSLSDGAPWRFGPDVRVLTDISDPEAFFKADDILRYPTCFNVNPMVLLKERMKPCVEDRRPLVFLWGDSYAAMLQAGLRKMEVGHKFGVAQFTTGSTPPFFMEGKADTEHTPMTRRELNENVLRAAVRLHPEIIVLTWCYLDDWPSPIPPERSALLLAETVARIHASLPATKVVVIGPVPNWDGGIVKVAVDALQKSPDHRVPTLTDYGLSEEPWIRDRLFKVTVPRTGATYVSALDLLCVNHRCPMRIGGNAYDLSAIDWGHFTYAGSDLFASRLMPILEKLLAEVESHGSTVRDSTKPDTRNAPER